MNTANEEKLIFNTSLAKMIGFYHILNPETIKYRGYNVYHIIIVALFVFYVCPLTTVFSINTVYYWANNTMASVMYLLVTENCLLICYKMTVIIYYSKDIWNCTEVIRFDFMSYKFYNKCLLEKWRNISIRVTTIYATLIVSALLCCLVSPLLFADSCNSIKSHNGFISNYRLSVLNMYLLVSSETFNKYFSIFYSIEVLYCSAVVIVFIFFDTVLVTICLAIACQLQIISQAFESFGRNLNIQSSSK